MTDVFIHGIQSGQQRSVPEAAKQGSSSSTAREAVFNEKRSEEIISLFSTRLLTAVIGISLSGCMVGPDFRKPEAPSVMDYTSTALPRRPQARTYPAEQPSISR